MPYPPRLDPGDALFLDLDGTLAPIAATPGEVSFDPRLAGLMARLEQAMGGALAVISGRSLEDVRRILGGSPGAVGAVHGLVRHLPGKGVTMAEPSADLSEARERLQAVARAWPGVIVEDKGLGLALHYRQAPEAEQAVKAAAAAIVAAGELVRQDGAMVCELRAPGGGKGEALTAFLGEAPFAGRRPVMVGDDLTDEDGFAAAEAAGGYGVLVGPGRETAARYRLDDVEAVIAWLSAGLAADAA
jgi:trehalose 6-phosphate phosphatase